jgi:hypothetical protein
MSRATFAPASVASASSVKKREQRAADEPASSAKVARMGLSRPRATWCGSHRRSAAAMAASSVAASF